MRRTSLASLAALPALCSPMAAHAQAMAIVDVRIGIAAPVQRGAVTVAQNVEFGLVTAPSREDGLTECIYTADPDRPVFSRSASTLLVTQADPAGACQFLAGAPQPGIVDLQCDNASNVSLQFTMTSTAPSNRVRLLFSTRSNEFLKVNGTSLSTFDGQCQDGTVRLVLTPSVTIFSGALPTGGSLSLATIRIDAAFS